MMLLLYFINTLAVSAVPLQLVTAHSDDLFLTPQMQNWGCQNVTETITNFAFGISESIKDNFGSVMSAFGPGSEAIASSLGQLSMAPFVQSVAGHAAALLSKPDTPEEVSYELMHGANNDITITRHPHLEPSELPQQQALKVATTDEIPSVEPPVAFYRPREMLNIDPDTLVHFARGFISQML